MSPDHPLSCICNQIAPCFMLPLADDVLAACQHIGMISLQLHWGHAARCNTGCCALLLCAGEHCNWVLVSSVGILLSSVAGLGGTVCYSHMLSVTCICAWEHESCCGDKQCLSNMPACVLPTARASSKCRAVS